MSRKIGLKATFTTAAIVVAVILAAAYSLQLWKEIATLSTQLGDSPGE